MKKANEKTALPREVLEVLKLDDQDVEAAQEREMEEAGQDVLTVGMLAEEKSAWAQQGQNSVVVEHGGNSAASSTLAVGAFRVRGPSGRGQLSDDEDWQSESDNDTVNEEEDPKGDTETSVATDTKEPTTLVHAYTVEEESAAAQESSDKFIPKAEIIGRSSPKFFALAIISIAIIVAVVLLVMLPRDRSNSNKNLTEKESNDLILASFECESQMVMQAEIKRAGLVDNSTISSGSLSFVWCSVERCIGETFGACHPRQVFDPTKPCCVGLDEDGCPESERCGALCFFTDVCTPIDPNDKDCRSADCATCQADYKGEIPYLIQNMILEFDCVHAGRSVRESNGEVYNWMIMCGPVVVPAFDMREGDWSCTAVRSGAGFSDEDGGIFSEIPSCHFIQHSTCGCLDPTVTPVDWLPPPEGQCLTPDDGCPFLCTDAGPTYVRDLCYHFPGDIEWWEGNNSLEFNTFAPNVVERELRRGCEVELKDGFF